MRWRFLTTPRGALAGELASTEKRESYLKGEILSPFSMFYGKYGAKFRYSPKSLGTFEKRVLCRPRPAASKESMAPSRSIKIKSFLAHSFRRVGQEVTRWVRRHGCRRELARSPRHPVNVRFRSAQRIWQAALPAHPAPPPPAR